MSKEKAGRGRYPRENGKVIVDVVVGSPRQLFDERDPAPFRERDLDEDFVAYVLNSVQEFPLHQDMKLRIFVRDDADKLTTQTILSEAISRYFAYESRMVQFKIRERLKRSRWFFMIGLLCLFICLSIAQLITSLGSDSSLLAIAREGFVIVGWVAMWRPVEVILYDWWPLRDQKLYLEKIAAMEVEVRHTVPGLTV